MLQERPLPCGTFLTQPTLHMSANEVLNWVLKIFVSFSNLPNYDALLPSALRLVNAVDVQGLFFLRILQSGTRSGFMAAVQPDVFKARVP